MVVEPDPTLCRLHENEEFGGLTKTLAAARCR
jgi:hypothetical protein